MTIRPYFIVPKLIPQPTWGGNYIATYKGITNPVITTEKIGQSYELCGTTMLSTESDPTKIPLEIADPKTGTTIDVIGDKNAMFPLQELIESDPEAVLGRSYLEVYGSSMQILIKFTQAKGNSFQVHVRPGHEIWNEGRMASWKPKPESWYFLENGRATLGLKAGVDLSEYKEVCAKIQNQVEMIASQVKDGSLTIASARAQIQMMLRTEDPYQFVNTVDLPKGAVIDLSSGGIHHSWEEGQSLPDGNIVYEVQREVMDEDCTLRSFDKGKIGDDGLVRPVHIDDYFAALDNDPDHNALDSLVRSVDSAMIFSSPSYETLYNQREESLDTFLGSTSFIHRFSTAKGVQKGWSMFIPWSSRR